MPPRQTEEEQADFARALQSVADQSTLPQAELDALSVLEGGDLDRFHQAFSTLPAPARARLIIALRGAAEERLRLDYGPVNRLALDDPDAQVRLAGVQAAIEDRGYPLLRKLLELVEHDPSIDVRWAAAEDLARFTLLCELEDFDAKTIADVRERLSAIVADASQAPKVRASALAALGYFSDTDTAEALARGFLDPNLRIGAVRGMGRTADPRWTDRLMPVLGSDDPDQRLEAARALGEIEDDRAVTPLVELVDDPDTDVRLAVIEALGKIGGEDAREALLYLAEAGDDQVGEAAERALEDLEAEEEDPLDV
jgi:HEAT repeat protein